LALGDADEAIARLDLAEQRLELPPRQPDFLLQLAKVARRRRRAAAARLHAELLQPMARAADRHHDLVDQRRLERHLRDDLLDRAALRLDEGLVALTRRRGAALVPEAFLQALDLPRVTTDAREREQHRPDGLRIELAPLGQDHHLV